MTSFYGPTVPKLPNGILTAPFSMPFKDFTADGAASFAMGRRQYADTSRANSGLTVAQANQKKWFGGNHDMSGDRRAANRRIVAIGLGSLNVLGGPNSFKTSVDHNTERNARNRVRSSGSVAPAKKGLNRVTQSIGPYGL